MSTILPASAGCPSSVDLRRQRPGSASQPPLHLPQVQPDTVGPTLASVPESSPPGNTVVSRDAKMDSAIIGENNLLEQLRRSSASMGEKEWLKFQVS
ncbi:uncharacterized protein [Narcine bancroftii]|uniref:uncharacterized protein isoform X5 n=1 Tax=Narcine bancroftii TaxID=1343680 RepID=UPI00383160E5